MSYGCVADNCGRPIRARQLCTLHYQRWRAHGDTSVQLVAKGASVSERLVRYSQRRANGCLEWTGAVNKNGYGKIQLDGRTRIVSRVAWEEVNGSIPDGQMVCHHCDNPPCIEITHLFLGSAAENVQDMVRKGRKYLMRGEDHHLTTLTESDIRLLRAEVSQGLSFTAASEKYGISKTTVRRITLGESWAHVA